MGSTGHRSLISMRRELTVRQTGRRAQTYTAADSALCASFLHYVNKQTQYTAGMQLKDSGSGIMRLLKIIM